MSGDYSRRRFDPRKHYQGVLRQQGRVDLDADWNEYVDIQDRRWRAETIDVVGRCGVPSETPDGFKVGRSGEGLTIGPGRIYVDGYLVENHGEGGDFDPTIEEDYSKSALRVEMFPSKPSLVYLDVWRREVTHVLEPDLIEPAVNVDTTTRYQTFWKVRVLGIDKDVTCETPFDKIKDWEDRARLTTGTVEVPQESNPCLVPPTGGYRGLENHLYRVEVHSVSGTTVGVKWSRENAHVVARVVEIKNGGTSLKVDSLGRDETLSFKNTGWVEILRDKDEFGGVAGTMRQVEVDPTNQVLKVAALDSTQFPDGRVNEADHLRVIRWDQSGGEVTISGVIELTPEKSSVVLGDGIQVTLDGLSDARVGDYWCFAARTADADIERLVKAPPHGIHHHYCKLAIIESNGKIHDCRPVFRPLTEIAPGCCTVVVYPGQDIQAAIDSLPEAGGCVCLKVGDHKITEPIRIERSNVSLHGESLGARVVRDNGVEVLQVRTPNHVQLENLTIVGISFHLKTTETQEPDRTSPVIRIDQCRHVELDGCILHSDDQIQNGGVLISNCTDVRMISCSIEHLSFGVWVVGGDTFTGTTRGIEIEGNIFDALVKNQSDGGTIGILLRNVLGVTKDQSFPVKITNNRIQGFVVGIAISDTFSFDKKGMPFSRAAGSMIAGNHVLRLGVSKLSGIIDSDKVFAIEVAADDCTISDNVLLYDSPLYGGIWASGDNAVVERNQLRSLIGKIGKDASGYPLAIVIANFNKDTIFGSAGGRIVGNHLAGPQDGIILIGVNGADILDNYIESDSVPARLGILTVSCNRTMVRGNRVTNAAWALAANGGRGQSFRENILLHGVGGITCNNYWSLTCAENRIENMSQWGVICLSGFEQFTFSRNRVLSCGYDGLPAIALGVLLHIGELSVESCEIMNTGVSPDNKTISPKACGLYADLVLEARVESNLVTYANIELLRQDHEYRALWLRGWWEEVTGEEHGNRIIGFSAQILDNKFISRGAQPLVEIQQLKIHNSLFRRFENVCFCNNLCWQRDRTTEEVVISLFCRSAVVMGNHIKSVRYPAGMHSVDFHDIRHAVYIGNIADGTLKGDFVGIPTESSKFNIVRPLF